MDQSVFRQDRLDTLIEQYRRLARTGPPHRFEQVTELLRNEGFSEEQLVTIYIEATMHVDDVPPDFEPDLDAAIRLKESMDPHPAECTCARCRPRTPEAPHKRDDPASA